MEAAIATVVFAVVASTSGLMNSSPTQTLSTQLHQSPTYATLVKLK
jgi:hypothetical protein